MDCVLASWCQIADEIKGNLQPELGVRWYDKTVVDNFMFANAIQKPKEQLTYVIQSAQRVIECVQNTPWHLLVQGKPMLATSSKVFIQCVILSAVPNGHKLSTVSEPITYSNFVSF